MDMSTKGRTMAATAYPMSHDRRVAGRHLRLVRPGETFHVPRRSSHSVYRRRRIAVAVLAVVTLLAARMLLGALGGGALASPEPAAPALIGQSSYVVQPGDTLWSVARSLQPRADPRPLVDRLAAHRHGAPLRVGERLAL
jgi:hypothetical protein